MGTRIRTHKYKDPISIFLPSFRHFIVVFSRHLRIHGEEMIRAIYKVGLALIFAVILCVCVLRRVTPVICSIPLSIVERKKYRIRLNGTCVIVPPFQPSF